MYLELKLKPCCSEMLSKFISRLYKLFTWSNESPEHVFHSTDLIVLLVLCQFFLLGKYVTNIEIPEFKYVSSTKWSPIHTLNCIKVYLNNGKSMGSSCYRGLLVEDVSCPTMCIQLVRKVDWRLGRAWAEQMRFFDREVAMSKEFVLPLILKSVWENIVVNVSPSALTWHQVIKPRYQIKTWWTELISDWVPWGRVLLKGNTKAGIRDNKYLKVWGDWIEK